MMSYSSHRTRMGSVQPGNSMQRNMTEEDKLIESLRCMAIPEGSLQANQSFYDIDSILKEVEEEQPESSTSAKNQQNKPTRLVCEKPSIASPDFDELGMTAENVRSGIQTLRSDLECMRKMHMDFTKSFKAVAQKKLLEFRKKAARVDDVVRSKLDANNNEVFANSHPVREQRHRLTLDQSEYKEKLRLAERDLSGLEVHMELIRVNVIQTKQIEYPSQLGQFREELKAVIKQVADVKNKFYGMEDLSRRVMESELEVIQQEKKFLKEEPSNIEQFIKRCKMLSTTLETFQKLASMQSDTQRKPYSR